MSYFLENSYLIDLCLVKCQDEHWFIIDDTGEIQDDNLVDKYSEKFIEPRFFENEELVTEYALQVIHKISGVPIKELKQFYSE